MQPFLFISLLIIFCLSTLMETPSSQFAEAHLSLSDHHHHHGDHDDSSHDDSTHHSNARFDKNNNNDKNRVPRDRLEAVASLSDEMLARQAKLLHQKHTFQTVRYVSIAFSGGGGGAAAEVMKRRFQNQEVASDSFDALETPFESSSCEATITESFVIEDGVLTPASPIAHPQPLEPKENGFYKGGLRDGYAGVHPHSSHYLLSYLSRKGPHDDLDQNKDGSDESAIEYGTVFTDPRVSVGFIHSDEDRAEGEHGDGELSTAASEGHQKKKKKKGALSVVHYATVGYRSFRVPLDVAELRLHCHCIHQRNATHVDAHAIRPLVLRLPAVATSNGGEGEKEKQASREGSSSKEGGVRSGRSSGFHPQEDGIEVRTFHYAGPPSKVANMVFVSDGFKADDKQRFFNKIGQIWDLMNALGNPSTNHDIDNMHKSVPMNRYSGFWNVYAVFQPSGVEGTGTGQSAGTNLGCFRPQNMPRGIQCDVRLSIALAGVAPVNIQGAPDRTVIVAIANTPVYGGTGIFSQGFVHIGAFYHGDEVSASTGQSVFAPQKYLSLVSHEIGHAFGALFDEYDFGFAEPRVQVLANCQAGSGGGPPAAIQWQNWINIFSDANQANFYRGSITDRSNSRFMYDVLQTPSPSCGYSNYYKANAHCMMQYLNNYFMCPICREACLKTIFSLTKFELQWPRFPSEGDVYLVPRRVTGTNASVVSTQTGLVLHLPGSLTADNQFAVTWKGPNGEAIDNINSPQCPQCALITPTMLQSFPNDQTMTVTATIVDNTNFMSPTAATANAANLRQTARFLIRVVDSVEVANATYSATWLTLMSAPIDRNSFGSYALLGGMTALLDCRASPGGCVLDISATGGQNPDGGNYTLPPEVPKLLSEWDSWIVIVVIAVGAFFVLLWIIAACKFYSQGSRVARPIFKTKFTRTLKIIRMIMRLSAIVFMLASLGTIVIAILFYVKQSALGQIIIIAGVILAFFLYVMAFIGFWAVTSRVKRLTIANAIILVFGAGCLVAIASIVFTIGSDIQSDDAFWTKQLNSLWQTIVADYPDRACALQDMLSCSGFLLPCNGIVPSTLYCPANCVEVNRDNGTPCRGRIQDYISENYWVVLAIVVVAAVLMVLAILFNAIYLVSLSRLKREIRERLTERSFSHARKNKVSTNTMEHTKALTILKTLDASDVTRLIKEFFRIDINGDGEIDRDEMTVFFRRALCHHIARNELDVLYEVADLDGNGTISLEEFLTIFNHKMPTIEENPDAYKYAFRKQDNLQQVVGKSIAKVKGNLQFGLEPINSIRRKGSLFFGGGKSDTSLQSENEMTAVNTSADHDMTQSLIGEGGGAKKRGDSKNSNNEREHDESGFGQTVTSRNNSFVSPEGGGHGRRSSVAEGLGAFGRMFMAYDEKNEQGMEAANARYFKQKTEADLEREIELRKRAQTRLKSAGLYTEADEAATKALEVELENLRSKNEKSRNMTAAVLNSYADPFAAGGESHEHNETTTTVSTAVTDNNNNAQNSTNLQTAKRRAPVVSIDVPQENTHADDDDMGITIEKKSSPAAARRPRQVSINDDSGMLSDGAGSSSPSPRKTMQQQKAGGSSSVIDDSGMLDDIPIVRRGSSRKLLSKEKRPSLALSDIDIMPSPPHASAASSTPITASPPKSLPRKASSVQPRAKSAAPSLIDDDVPLQGNESLVIDFSEASAPKPSGKKTKKRVVNTLDL